MGGKRCRVYASGSVQVAAGGTQNGWRKWDVRATD